MRKICTSGSVEPRRSNPPGRPDHESAWHPYSAASMEELSRLPQSLRKLALDRFHLLQPHLEEGRPLRPLAIKAGISYRTAQRWLRQYQRSGLAALVRKRGLTSA